MHQGRGEGSNKSSAGEPPTPHCNFPCAHFCKISIGTGVRGEGTNHQFQLGGLSQLTDSGVPIRVPAPVNLLPRTATSLVPIFAGFRSIQGVRDEDTKHQFHLGGLNQLTDSGVPIRVPPPVNLAPHGGLNQLTDSGVPIRVPLPLPVPLPPPLPLLHLYPHLYPYLSTAAATSSPTSSPTSPGASTSTLTSTFKSTSTCASTSTTTTTSTSTPTSTSTAAAT